MRILGIDPGLQVAGYGVVALGDGALEPALVEAGVIRLQRSLSVEDRLAVLYRDLGEVITELRPDAMAVEKLFAHYKHPRTAILMAHARGVILLCARQHGLSVEHLPATAVKKALTGYGHASKEQMQRAVMTQCRLKEVPSPPDVADAIAIALTHGRRVALARM